MSHAPEYEEFARTISLPMFRRHHGFLGVLFTGTGAERAVITLWSYQPAAVALDASADYQATVRAIEATDFLDCPSGSNYSTFTAHGPSRSVTALADDPSLAGSEPFSTS